MKLIENLLNISHNFYYLNGRNFDIIHSTLKLLIKNEQNSSDSEHIQNWNFSRNLLIIADRLLSGRQQTPIFTRQFFEVLETLNEYGRILAGIHLNKSFLKPFQFVGEKIGKT